MKKATSKPKNNHFLLKYETTSKTGTIKSVYIGVLHLHSNPVLMKTSIFLDAIYHTIEEIEIIKKKFNLNAFECEVVDPAEERKLLKLRYGKNILHYGEASQEV